MKICSSQLDYLTSSNATKAWKYSCTVTHEIIIRYEIWTMHCFLICVTVIYQPQELYIHVLFHKNDKIIC